MNRMLPRRSVFFGLLAVGFSAALATSARGADNWVEVKSAHFTLATNAGEKDGRKILDQFELFRSTFHSAFASLRVDPSQPTIILAAKNENTMKELLPEEYGTKGHIHHVGMFQRGHDKNYVILRLDAEGQNPYHTLYHEYTHSMASLNFANLPLWLDEGLAEYLGNAQLSEKDVRIGLIDPSHLYILQQNKLLPIETLLSVDHGSPYYNEENRASVFYAESWALVHYLMLDPEARKQQLLSKFIQAWSKSGDQVTAATQTFGDLKKFGKVIEGYSRQSSFYNGLIKPPTDGIDKNYVVRPLQQAEVLALRADFFVHHNRPESAVPVLAMAAQLDANLPFLHEAQGICEYRRGNMAAADHEMKEAIRLGTKSFVPFYYHGYFSLFTGDGSESSIKEAQEALTKAVQMNPGFAPAYDALASAYERSEDMQAKALEASLKAANLEPSTLSYSVHLTYLLMNNRRNADAEVLAGRIAKAANTPSDKQMAEQLEQHLKQRAEWGKYAGSADGTSTVVMQAEGPVVLKEASQEHDSDAPASASRPGAGADPNARYAADGPIDDASCSAKGQDVVVTLGLSTGPVSFHAADLSKIDMSIGPEVTPAKIKNCAMWKGLRAKIWFSATPEKPMAGEIVKLHLF